MPSFRAANKFADKHTQYLSSARTTVSSLGTSSPPTFERHLIVQRAPVAARESAGCSVCQKFQRLLEIGRTSGTRDVRQRWRRCASVRGRQADYANFSGMHNNVKMMRAPTFGPTHEPLSVIQRCVELGGRRVANLTEASH